MAATTSARIPLPPRRTGFRVLGALLTLWASVAALLAAVIVAIAWDLRS